MELQNILQMLKTSNIHKPDIHLQLVDRHFLVNMHYLLVLVLGQALLVLVQALAKESQVSMELQSILQMCLNNSIHRPDTQTLYMTKHHLDYMTLILVQVQVLEMLVLVLVKVLVLYNLGFLLLVQDHKPIQLVDIHLHFLELYMLQHKTMLLKMDHQDYYLNHNIHSNQFMAW